ncbi:MULTISPECIES: triose-phosphate isomerase [Caldanaerobacter]|uniref:Triosephosphate isomerase n=5 Tax=Caldanaerobacter subterraneus TaxID=911092 RepID=TPIS_CALS4|nr:MULTISPECIES: triose-phosphate isomerase [Caldanaerobacter]Q8R966.1 RecName: Full=Triosephosphate isomerase; Short=TIM; Short=TPI; AltName: Full=Triose-phosphate isomerase [Caldanaerobacter subterraneus subsp. tengcongensis MB4]AAM24954.1 Triosephosphate isomerase [Caldanaerobacter subterraneus subsp. tengcongensis MB4]ERM93214.1 triosephosphate isomerase [Caldanaerobacter subterraneus subsp. yonseiensis KB-1]KKC29359.1 triosephosphate isomerase [Caldanaerobacter subterraneus subsp. pacificu
MRRPIIAGNWKMHKTPSEAVKLVEELIPLVKDAKAEVVVIPPFVDLTEVARVIKGTNILLGAQNMFWEEKGAYTGEISPVMLKEIGVTYVVIGHSERRQYFKETDEMVNKKVLSALSHDLKPIVCVGESLSQREEGKTYDVVLTQTREALKGVSEEDITKVVIAYEPVWAIGTGKNATPQDANEVIKAIRNTIAELYGKDKAEMVRIQYGGSVKPDNISGFMAESDIDGALVGGASLVAEDFAKIVNY